jgi:hypothetical protein
VEEVLVVLGDGVGGAARMSRGSFAAILLLGLCVLSTARAQPAPAGEPSLSRYLEAMVERRLLVTESASEAQLAALVAEGERLFLDGRYDAASALLLEAVESPRFADFRDFDAYVAAEHMAGSALYRLGSLKTARRYLQRLIVRGPNTAYYGPGVRRYVDVALQLGDLQAAADWLARAGGAMPEDARHELAYVRARAAQQGGDASAAARLFGQVGKRSRFYANAQYLLGVIAAHERRYAQAEQRFCQVAGPGTADRYGFYVDDRYFEVLDLARLALGRTAHERGRGEDAFYYYFQVPQDSPRLSSALFEAAWSSYESSDHDTAVDLLEQLEARFPESSYADEAGVLQGYVSLARCDFQHADRHFARFTHVFGPLAAELDRLLDNPVRTQSLYEDLLLAEGGARQSDAQRRLLLGLLRVDPEFYRLHAAVKALDAEAARAGRLPQAFAEIRARLTGGDKPHAAAAPSGEPATEVALAHDLEHAFTITLSLGEQLDALRAAGASRERIAAAEKELAALSRRFSTLRERALATFEAALPPAGDGSQPAPQATGLVALLALDQAAAREFPARVALVRGKLVASANARALAAVRELRGRLGELLRSASIGRVDAVMGSKHRIEAQIESLAAGRFPPELRDPLRVQGLLADDEEYWPFQGEDWPDEYEEHYDPLPKPAPPAPASRGGAPK